ncbi:hypothetical protein ACFL7D_00855 [candidate division KSB1 bacterium]
MKTIFSILKYLLIISSWLILLVGVLWLLWLFVTVVLPFLLVLAIIVIILFIVLGKTANSESINYENNSEEYDYPDLDIFIPPSKNELHEKGFETEYVASGYLKVYHPNYPKHIAIIEKGGSISLSQDIADKIPGQKSYRTGNVGRFIYRWDEAKDYSSEEIIKLLYNSI